MVGIKHRLLVREEGTYGETGGNSIDGTEFKSYYAYSNVGSRPSKSITQISGTTLNRVAKAPTVGRQTVSGGFSFYLPAKNFGVFYKNLLGSWENDIASGTTSGFPSGKEAHFTTAPILPSDSQGLGFVSYFDALNIFVYDGMLINSATITCSDPNSLAEISLDFIGNDLRRVVSSGASGSDTSLNDLDFSWDHDPSSTDTPTQLNKPNIINIDLALSDIDPQFFVGWKTQIASTDAYATSIFDRFRNLSISFDNSLGYDGLISNKLTGTITDSVGSNEDASLYAGLIGHDRNSPIPTAQRSISGSFEIPYPSTATQRINLAKLINNINETKGNDLFIKFQSEADQQTWIIFDKVYFNVPDFTAITNEITTMPINFVAAIDCLTATQNAHTNSEVKIVTLESQSGLPAG